MVRRLFAVPNRRCHGAGVGHHVTAGEHAGTVCLHVRSDDDGAVVLEVQPRHLLQERGVRVLTQREDERVGLQRLELARRLRGPVLVEPHDFDPEARIVDVLDRAEPVNLHAFLECFVGFEGMRRHLRARAAVDDQRFGAESTGGAGRVHRRVAPAVDGDAPAQSRRFFAALHVLEKGERVVDLSGVASGDLLSFAQVAPIAKNTASNPPAAFSAARSVTL